MPYEDEWDYRGRQWGHVPPQRSYGRGSNDYLNPGGYSGYGHHRSRSVGGSPVPHFNVYNYNSNSDDHDHSPAPRSRSRSRPPLAVHDDELQEEVERLRRDLKKRNQSPYVREPSPRYDQSMYWQMYQDAQRVNAQQALLKQQQDYARADVLQKEYERMMRDVEGRFRREHELEHLSDMESRARWEKEEELMRKKLEIKRLQDKLKDEGDYKHKKLEEDRFKRDLELERIKADAKRREQETELEDIKRRIRNEEHDRSRKLELERERILLEAEHDRIRRENERKQLILEQKEADRRAKEDQKRIAEDWRRKEKEEEDERKDAEKRAVEAYERKKKEDKEKEEALRDKFKQEEIARKQKEKDEEERWKQKLKDKEREEKRKKKEEEEKIRREMHERMHRFGFQENQIDAMLDPRKADKLPMGASPQNALTHWHSHQKPTYIKMHRDHIEIDTLKYYGVPWEYDPVNTDYLIILQEMDTEETDILFEHTRRLRKGGRAVLTIEDRGRRNKPEYAFVRRKSKSPAVVGRRRSSPKRAGLFNVF